MKKKKALITASILACAFAGAAHLEWVGYNYFDRENGGNILCTIDPQCRQLTQSEITTARKYFGNTINYKSVKVFDRPFMYVVGHNWGGTAPNGNIYFANRDDYRSNFTGTQDDSRKIMHELTHVAQHQGGMDIPKLALRELVKHAFNYSESYKYSIATPLKFHELNLEQQAELMEDYSSMRNDFARMTTFPTESGLLLRTSPRGHEWLKARCDEMALYEKKLAKHFPVGRDSLCP